MTYEQRYILFSELWFSASNKKTSETEETQSQ